MLVVHATKKLLDRIGRPTVEPTTRSTTLLGSWYATVLSWRPQVVLLVNERTPLPVLMPLAPAATLLERLPTWLAGTFDAHGVPRTFIEAEPARAESIGLARTSNRSVLGVMNEFAQLASWTRRRSAATTISSTSPSSWYRSRPARSTSVTGPRSGARRRR